MANIDGILSTVIKIIANNYQNRNENICYCGHFYFIFNYIKYSQSSLLALPRYSQDFAKEYKITASLNDR